MPRTSAASTVSSQVSGAFSPLVEHGTSLLRGTAPTLKNEGPRRKWSLTTVESPPMRGRGPHVRSHVPAVSSQQAAAPNAVAPAASKSPGGGEGGLTYGYGTKRGHLTCVAQNREHWRACRRRLPLFFFYRPNGWDSGSSFAVLFWWLVGDGNDEPLRTLPPS